MPATLTIRDEVIPGQVDSESVLYIPSERITVEELIKRRVFQEVEEHNAKQPEHFRGLVQPNDTEKTLNGFRFKKPQHPIDAEEQYAQAIEGFERNGFILMIDDQQVMDLDEEIEIRPSTTATFLKLVPLVGG